MVSVRIRMTAISLRARIMALIVALVTGVVFVLSVLYLNDVLENWSADVLERSDYAAQQVKNFVVPRITEQTRLSPLSNGDLDSVKRRWQEIVVQDTEIDDLLVKTLANSRFILEILIAGESGHVLASSNYARRGQLMSKLPNFANWRRRPLTSRVREILFDRRDYEVTIPLGVEEQKDHPIFTIQVVVSSVLLKDAIRPLLRNLAFVSFAALLLSSLIGILAANLALRPLARINQELDRLTGAQAPKEAKKPKTPLGTETREIAIVQDKLQLLGQQIKGAREDATQLRSNIDQLMQRLEEAVLLADSEGRLVQASSSTERILERDRNQILGKRLDEIFPIDSPLGSTIQQTIRESRILRDHVVNYDQPGKPVRRLLVNIELLEDLQDKRRTGTILTLRDADTRRQLATQLDVSSRLSAINRLTSGVAHEIKNPLNAIALRLELLRSSIQPDQPEAENISVISREIRRLDRVVKTFLDFTRPVNLVIRDLDLTEIVREVTTLVALQAEQQRVIVDVQSPAAPVTIGGDRDLLKQAVLNVVVNGIEAMKSGGKLVITVEHDQQTAVIRVSDEGPGIAPEFRDKVFQLYFTTKEKGSGIGLAMTFRAVQMHNGTIEFYNTNGRGATFQMRFPLEAKPDKEQRQGSLA